MTAGRQEKEYSMEQQQEKQEPITLEEAFGQLDAVVGRLESREISLEESFQIYQDGMKLLKTCSEKIDRVEKAMMQLDENGELSEF